MLNVAITANTSWYIYNFRKNTIKKLINDGCKVTVISPRDEFSKKLTDLGVDYFHVNIDSNGVSPFKDLKFLISVFKILKKNNIDLILNFTPKNNIYCTLAAYSLKIKIINNISGLGVVFTKQGLLPFLVKFLYKISQRKADFIFFQNEDDRELFVRNLITPIEKTEVIPGSGVDLTRFKLSQFKKSEPIVFLLICRMLYQKGVIHYMDAAKQLREKYNERVRFDMVGFIDESNPQYVKKEEIDCCVDAGIVNYLGSSNFIEKELFNADCVVLPSFYREGTPKSLLEAAAMGKPIVTTDSVGCRNVVDDGVNGFLCSPQDVNSLVEQLEKIILMPHNERQKFCLSSRRKAEKQFDERIVINKYIEKVFELTQ